jgi:hypothetical protein
MTVSQSLSAAQLTAAVLPAPGLYACHIMTTVSRFLRPCNSLEQNPAQPDGKRDRAQCTRQQEMRNQHAHSQSENRAHTYARVLPGGRCSESGRILPTHMSPCHCIDLQHLPCRLISCPPEPAKPWYVMAQAAVALADCSVMEPAVLLAVAAGPGAELSHTATAARCISLLSAVHLTAASCCLFAPQCCCQPVQRRPCCLRPSLNASMVSAMGPGRAL